ncbi:MAG: MFS transporter [Bacteroidetes bacterium]|jgi:MFS family permease|nr:MFS transporter [Bacteroidota bacterium]
MIQNDRLYTLQFWLLAISHALFGASFSMIIPELPAYLTTLGGGEYKGLIIALFTLTAGISRPFSGKLTDTIGRMPVMIFGTLVCVVCSLFYPILTSVAGFLLLRFFHGFSTGFKPTASTAYVADIVPINRRGEAMGIMGVAMNTGASIAPPFGSWLAMEYSLDIMFYVSSGFALVSILILMNLKETLKEKQPFKVELLKISKSDILDPSAIAPAIVTLAVYLNLGVMLTIVPDHSVYLGIENKGLFLMSLTAFSLLSRFFAGKISDRFGRVLIIKVSIISLALSLIWMGYANSAFSLLASSGAIGFSVGIAAPAIFAWTIDRSEENRRGRAMATVYIALEVGIGAGAILSAWIYNNDYSNFGIAFFITAFLTILGYFYLQFVLVTTKE